MTRSSKAMSSRERVWRAKIGEKPDKLPIVVINSNTFTCLYYGIDVEEYISESKKCADVHLKFIQEFEIDCAMIAAAYILYGTGPELGVKWEFAGNNFPGAVDGPIQSEADISKIEVPRAPSGYFRHYLDTVRMVNEALGQTYYLTANVLGPFAVACFLHGIEKTLIDMSVNKAFFKELMKVCAKISVFLGEQVIATGLDNPILNEIFLSPGMIRPDTYHSLIAPYDLEVQCQLGFEKAPNSFVFMGRPNDPDSQKVSSSLNKAFFGVDESIEAIGEATQGDRPPGYPFPVGISGRALASWSIDSILSFLTRALEVVIQEKGLYPSINLPSIQVESSKKAREVADKIRAIVQFRDDYVL
jgi:hypothetical protein